MTNDTLRILHERLGIDPAYGRDPYRPEFAEASDLVDVGPNLLGRPQRLDPATAAAWSGMQAAAGEDGIQLILVSGFRSVADQVALIETRLARNERLEDILAVSAAPGFSQHHTGKAVDLAAPGARPLTEAFASTPAFEWLTGNAARFGFRMPYEPGNRFGFAWEPWHWSQID